MCPATLDKMPVSMHASTELLEMVFFKSCTHLHCRQLLSYNERCFLKEKVPYTNKGPHNCVASWPMEAMNATSRPGCGTSQVISVFSPLFAQCLLAKSNSLPHSPHSQFCFLWFQLPTVNCSLEANDRPSDALSESQ